MAPPAAVPSGERRRTARGGLGLSQTTPEPIRIRTAADLFQVLASGSLGALLALLRDVLANPRWQVRAQLLWMSTRWRA